MLSFGERLDAVFETSGHLCLGIDPHAFLLDSWGLPDSAAGVRDFALRCVDAATGVVGIVKPQVAFFERFGAAGYAALEDVLSAARGAGLLVIADAKRGDIGSTVAAYGAAWLSPGAPLEADAMTISAYQGVDSLADVVSLAARSGKGLFVLAATSNAESVETQTAVRDRGNFAGRTIAASIVGEVHTLNRTASRLGPTGVVIGATVTTADYGIVGAELAHTPILAPGFGEQGGLVSEVTALFGDVASNVIATVGRSVLRAGRHEVREVLLRQAELLSAGVTR